MKNAFSKTENSVKWLWGIALGLTAAKLLAVGLMYAYYCPPLAPLDDDLVFRAAVSITEGSWLGAYGWRTIAKHMGFSVWLAALHVLHIPYAVGGQLLWAAACGFTALAFSPLFKKRWQAPALYLALLFIPSAVAQFTFRVYRDNIFPALCLFVFAGFVGYALRFRGGLLKNALFLAAAGFGLGGAYLCREDGLWLAPFVLAAVFITGFYILREKDLPKKALRLGIFLLPLAIAGAMTAGYCTMNYLFYGRFIVSDFTSKEFKDAYGAMTRINAQDFQLDVSVPLDVREKLYENVPLFAELENDLEGDWIANGYRYSDNGDFRNGAFYWALRECVAKAGYYKDAQTAKNYYTQLAADINALCDSGVLPAGPKRSGTTPPIRPAYIAPTVKEAGRSALFVLTFRGCSPQAEISVGSEEELEAVKQFLYTPYTVTCRQNTNEAYLNPYRKIVYSGFRAVQALYAVLLPLCFLAALCYWASQWVCVFIKKRRPKSLLPLWLMTGLLGMAALRCFMIAFMEVSSFGIGTYAMYLSTVHPLALLFAFLGVSGLLQSRKAPKKESREEAAGALQKEEEEVRS